MDQHVTSLSIYMWSKYIIMLMYGNQKKNYLRRTNNNNKLVNLLLIELHYNLLKEKNFRLHR